MEGPRAQGATVVTDLRTFASARVVRLTTRGRKSGQPRTVTVWFAVAGPASIYVQHASRSRAQWYANLTREPSVTLDFGPGPLPARARPVLDSDELRLVLRAVRRKYRLAWFFQLLGWGRRPVAAEVTLQKC